MEDRERRVYEALASLSIPYVRREHPPVATVEEARLHWEGLEGARCKNLFVRNKPGKRHYLIVAEHLRPLDLLKLSHHLGDSRLSFASDERLMRHLGLRPGEVSPFGLLSEGSREVIVVLDAGLPAFGAVNLHPNVNTATLTIAYADLLKFLAWRGNRVLVEDL